MILFADERAKKSGISPLGKYITGSPEIVMATIMAFIPDPTLVVLFLGSPSRLKAE